MTEEKTYISPSILHRKLGREHGNVEQGIQFIVRATGHETYDIEKVQFFLQRGTYQASENPEINEHLASNLSGPEALTMVYQNLKKELQAIMNKPDGAPQVVRSLQCTSADGLELKDLQRIEPSLTGLFGRLSSDWGQKANRFANIPQKSFKPFHFQL